MSVQLGVSGFCLNLQMGTFQVSQKRVDAFLQVLQDVLAHSFVVSAHKVAWFTGLDMEFIS